MIYNTLHKKIKFKLHDPPKQNVVNSGFADWYVTPVMLLFENKLCMSKGRYCDYVKRNISLAICDTEMSYRSTKSWLRS